MIPIPAGRFPEGIVKDNLVVKLLNNRSIIEQCDIPIQFRLVSDESVSPPSIFCGIINQGESFRGKFVIESTSYRKLSLADIACSEPGFIQIKCIGSDPGKLLILLYATKSTYQQGDHSRTRTLYL